MNLLEYMLKFAFSYWHITILLLLIGAMVIKGKRNALSMLKDLLWKAWHIPSHHDELGGRLDVDTRDTNSGDRQKVIRSIDALREEGYSLYNEDPNHKKKKKK